MDRRSFTFSALGAMAAIPLGGRAMAAGYPSRTIEMIVPYSAGGGTDLVARAFADIANETLPKAIGVVNRTGGGGAVGLTGIARARPNGYTIGLGTAEITMLPHMGMASFKATDFTAIAQLNADPSAITVKADAPWQTLEEFVAHAKENPGTVRIGNSGTGAIWHLAAEAFGKDAGATFNHIPFEGAAPAVTSLLGGHIEAVSVSPAEVSNFVAAGELRMLGVMADERVGAFPEVPTFREQGIDLTVGTWRGVLVPNGLPDDALAVLREVAATAGQSEAFKAQLAKMNLNHAYMDADAFQAKIAAQDEFFGELMGELGMAR
ncbi:tripartite tricarboxylate transporter substrate binding protein [Mangrovicoccus sp. HB161399]|uniref:tripartite tricarboxylate transporter substrate binding protein n=1 Tax=Mangrovicoccus sp. HB161399 TaxID=2720392 RepID=UPI001556C48E|nr:tripartite tricarboxylate transporter substrate binding protein [Mangrovicoccus sp. HB161399]